MTADFDATFELLCAMLRDHAEGLTVAEDSANRFCLEAVPGLATLAAWGGKARRPAIPVAWVERGKTYVGYHLMGLNGNSALVDRLSDGLKARMQGKTCFNFRRASEAPLDELNEVTAASIAALRRAGYVARND